MDFSSALAAVGGLPAAAASIPGKAASSRSVGTNPATAARTKDLAQQALDLVMELLTTVLLELLAPPLKLCKGVQARVSSDCCHRKPHHPG